MQEEKLFEFMTKMYSEMQGGFKKVGSRLGKVDERLDALENDVRGLKKTVLIIEQDHGKKLEVIFDVLTQHTDQLERQSAIMDRIQGRLDKIEEEIKKHDFVLRRIK